VFFISELKTAAPDVEFMTKECKAVMNFFFLKEKKFISVTLGEKKIFPILKLKNGLLDSRQDISAQKMKTIQEGHLWSPRLKMAMLCSTLYYRSENFSQKDISGTCRVHHP